MPIPLWECRVVLWGTGLPQLILEREPVYVEGDFSGKWGNARLMLPYLDFLLPYCSSSKNCAVNYAVVIYAIFGYEIHSVS